MNQKYTIDEILIAISDLQNKKRERKNENFKKEVVIKNYSEIPKDTLRLIEEAEKKN
jgi:hypothetical protein